MNDQFDFKYFFALFLAGICGLIFLPYNNSAPAVIQSTDQSSYAAGLYSFAAVEDAELAQQDAEFEAMNNEWIQSSANTEQKDFELSPPAFEKFADEYEETAPTALPVSQEDLAKLKASSVKSCAPGTTSFESQILKSTALASLRSADYAQNFKSNDSEPLFAKSCLAYAMNSFPDGYGSTCKGLTSQPAPGANKACVTDTMVDITYNTYMEVMTCMGLNPKHVYPKLFNESGFLINTLGGGFDAGVAQMTRMGIQGANAFYETAMKNIKDVAAKNSQSSCARLLQNAALLTKAPEEKAVRCTMISPADNPLKGFFYAALLNRANIADAKAAIEANDLEERIKKLGYTNVDIKALTNIIGTLAYNSGLEVSFGALKSYVELREKDKLKLKASDFDFSETKEVKDPFDGVVKSTIRLATANIRSSYMLSKEKLAAESNADKLIRLKRRANLAANINNSYKLTFPEHLVYRQIQNFPQGTTKLPANFKTSGAPGYMSFLKRKDTEIRAFLTSVNLSPNLCSDPDFLRTFK
jgi:hypothetical protein